MPAVCFLLGVLPLIMGCAHTSEARVAGDLADVWLRPKNGGPLVLCGMSIPTIEDEKSGKAASLREKLNDTALIVLRESVIRLGLSGDATLASLMAKGGPALQLAGVAIALGQMLIAFVPIEGTCDEFEIAALQSFITEYQGIIDDLARLDRMIKSANDFTAIDEARREAYRIRAKIEHMKDPAEVAKNNREADAAILEQCERRLDFAPDCASRIMKDRSRRIVEH